MVHLYRKDIQARMTIELCTNITVREMTVMLSHTLVTQLIHYQRYYQHVQTGAIPHHNKTTHRARPYTRELLESTTVIYKNSSKLNMQIAEALLIKQHKPLLNQQDEGTIRVLKIF